MNPGVVLLPEDCPAIPDPHKEKFYRSFVAKLQFAATWIRFDIAYPVSQLARFCASAGTQQWSALHHLMEYLEGFSSLQLIYRLCKGASRDLPTGYADSDLGKQLIPPVHIWELDVVQQVSDLVALQDAEDHSALSTAEASRIGSRRGRPVSPKPPRATRLRSGGPHPGVRGQHRVHRVGQQRHWRT